MAGSSAQSSAVLLPLLLAICQLAAAERADEWRKPGFCGRMDCPRFTIWQKHFDFQVREYEPVAWVVGTAEAASYEAAVKNVTQLLFAYFWGDNDETLRMKEAVPLVVLMPNASDATAPPAPVQHFKNYTVGMYIPDEHQDKPPKPSSSRLFINYSPRVTMFVRMFEHRTCEDRVKKETAALLEALEHAGHTDVMRGMVHAASYDHPLKHHPKHWHRKHPHHSEIWVPGNWTRDVSRQ